MISASSRILRTYVTLMLLSTFASSLIWGINTLFLLDAGLTITQAFAANAFFTFGQVIFEVPTGIVADTVGRRMSYLLGSATLFASTLFYLYLWQTNGSFLFWALSSILLGLGFTFFSGATEAWLVDGLNATKFKGTLESAFAKGQIASGIATLTGSIAGGYIAQSSNLGVPYILRSLMLLLTFGVAFVLMKDIGFKPRKSVTIKSEIRNTLRASVKHGLGNAPVRHMMLSGIFVTGVVFYGFYAMQPYLLELYGSESYGIAGLAAAIVAGAQIAGGLLVPYIGRLFKNRTSLLLSAAFLSVTSLAIIGLIPSFWVAISMLVVWAMMFAITVPVRQSFINGLIPSEQRATVLSSDNLLGSAGAAVMQPGLGKIADVGSYASSFVASAAVSALAIPFIMLAKRQRAKTDPITRGIVVPTA